jgi:hypothetical protein
VHYDIFNGDADGICALHQLRLVKPKEAELVTGVKRSINLLAKIKPQPGDHLTVLDISLDKNRNELTKALNTGASVTCFDHHYAGDIPKSENLEIHIDTSGETCTSLIVNRHLQGIFSIWSAVGAYGDNFYQAAESVVEPYNFSRSQLEQLKELGTVLNYNSYGIELSDLHFHPADLYQVVHQYADPFTFIHEEEKYQRLLNYYKMDLEQASSIKPTSESTKSTTLIHLPNTSWARRVSGIYVNQLARENPNKAHALLTELPAGGYRISLRAPLSTKQNADTLCRQFETGGGRAAAAGINHLKQVDYDYFVEKFIEIYS